MESKTMGLDATDAELRDRLAIILPSQAEQNAYRAAWNDARANPVKRAFPEAEARETAASLYGDRNLQNDIANFGFMNGAKWAWEKLNGET